VRAYHEATLGEDVIVSKVTIAMKKGMKKNYPIVGKAWEVDSGCQPNS
jgi:hypothetical protein